MEIENQKEVTCNPLKAWEYLSRLSREALPCRVEEKAVDKEMVEVVGRLIGYSDDYLMLMWKATPDSGAPSCMIAGAIGAVRNKGRDVTKPNELFVKGLQAFQNHDYVELHKITAQILKSLIEAPKISSHEYFTFEHPERWQDFEKKIPDQYYKFDVTTTEFEDKVYASWLGELVGGAFGGGPFEGYSSTAIKKVFGNITYYLGKPSTVNDDVTYELAFLEAFKEKGFDVTSEDIADKWLMYIPWGWTAETVAFENLRRGIYPPKSGSFLNFYSEWIGAQMRAGIVGLVAPGKPKLASRLAFLDGLISHEKNGVYAECYVAVLTSLAFVEKDIRTILVKALDYVPNRSEFHSVVTKAIDLCRNSKNWEEVNKKIEDSFKYYHWVHLYPNICIVVNSLWWSNGDFNEALKISVMSGVDTDCNCGVVGAILGVLLGTKGIDKKWYEPFRDVVETYNMRGKFSKMKITELAKETVNAVRKYW